MGLMGGGLFGSGASKSSQAPSSAGAQSQYGDSFAISQSANDDIIANTTFNQEFVDFGAVEGGLSAADEALNLAGDALSYYGEMGGSAIESNERIAGQAIASTQVLANETLRRESLLTGQVVSNLGASYAETLDTYADQSAAKFDAVSDAINAGAQDTAKRLAGLRDSPGGIDPVYLWGFGAALVALVWYTGQRASG